MVRAWSCVLLAACSGASEAPSDAACLVLEYGQTGVSGNTGIDMATGEVSYAGRLREIVSSVEEYYQLQIRLVPARGVFRDGVAAGTYVIAGDEGDTMTCGLCMSVSHQLRVSRAVTEISTFKAVSATVTLTSVAPTLEATATGLRFVLSSSMGGEPACEHQIETLHITSTAL